MSEPADIDITELETPDLLQQIKDDLYDGMSEPVVAGTRELLRRSFTPYEALTSGLVAGMDVVGVDFRDGILFVPEVLMAAKAMKAGMEVLRPLLAETGAPQIGTMVIGTVKGDIHDIGKNLVAMMLEGAGFQVINLGVNNDAQKFIDAVIKHQSNLVGLSALLTTTMPYMQTIIRGLKEAGLRDKVGVMIGGAPVTQAFADEIGADAYCRDAAIAVESAKRLIAIQRDLVETR
jgi:corrinoid protein of di/trimethylamine methyltransferase